jgi:FkbM family methyltransferase
MALEQDKIPRPELDLFNRLKNIKIVFDVGARIDVEYLELKPNIKLHIFEPNTEFFAELKRIVGNRENVFLNNYGLGDRECEVGYNNGHQAFIDGSSPTGEVNSILPIKTLNWYVKENKIKKIDFLKIDTEGYDYKVLIGASEIISNCKYIQYEHWNDKDCFHRLLENRFDMEYIGYRNVFCMNRRLVDEKIREELKYYIKENKFAKLA